MSLLALFSGLLLPWLAGAICLAAVERRMHTIPGPNVFRQAGYGFFLGYAVLYLLIEANQFLSGSVSWSWVMLALTALSIVGAIFLWRFPHKPINKRPISDAALLLRNKPLFWTTVLLLTWTAVHLLIYSIDIFSQPVYPWDAWLAWVYRAKAWFLSGDISAVISTTDWIKNPVAGSYTIDAWQYPTFASIIPYWAALSLGQWSETWVNLPVLFAALAIGMALYGQCREFGLSIFIAVLSCYLLYSIPLFGTHIALAGYADIWMSGFSGLGFVALLQAVVQRSCQPKQPYGVQMALAFILLSLAVLIKNEAAVWLLAAISMLVILSSRARVPILIFVSIGLLILFGFAFGITLINLPLIGTIGFDEGRLIIPFIGDFTLETHNIWHVYLSNFFTMGSWNLFWIMVLAAVGFAIQNNDNSTSRRIQVVGLTFISIFIATQIFIFGLTDQGLWADTFTAINRLPLHFVPALLFASFMIFDAISAKQVKP